MSKMKIVGIIFGLVAIASFVHLDSITLLSFVFLGGFLVSMVSSTKPSVSKLAQKNNDSILDKLDKAKLTSPDHALDYMIQDAAKVTQAISKGENADLSAKSVAKGISQVGNVSKNMYRDS